MKVGLCIMYYVTCLCIREENCSHLIEFILNECYFLFLAIHPEYVHSVYIQFQVLKILYTHSPSYS